MRRLFVLRVFFRWCMLRRLLGDSSFRWVAGIRTTRRPQHNNIRIGLAFCLAHRIRAFLMNSQALAGGASVGNVH